MKLYLHNSKYVPRKIWFPSSSMSSLVILFSQVKLILFKRQSSIFFNLFYAIGNPAVGTCKESNCRKKALQFPICFENRISAFYKKTEPLHNQLVELHPLLLHPHPIRFHSFALHGNLALNNEQFWKIASYIFDENQEWVRIVLDDGVGFVWSRVLDNCFYDFYFYYKL